MEEVFRGLEDWTIAEAQVAIERKLGIGGFAEVFAANWNGQSVAIKRFNGDLSGMTEKAKKELCRELSILASVEHKNLVQLLGVLLPYRPVRIMIELCCGGTCFELLHEKDVELTWPQNLKLCSEVAEAVAYLHGFDPPILHRDLKSLNVLLVQEVHGPQDVPFVKVADFGLARLKEDFEDGLSQMTTNVGSIPWMAPEVFDGDRYDEKVDVYSYAMIVYEVAGREIPFDEVDDNNEIRNLVSSGVRPDVNLLRPDCPPHLLVLMEACWDRDPSRRPDFEEIVQLMSSVAADSVQD
mmetsp:Transcript_7641/g.15963  ORF Transcript_7641/g.15963 Transcript_7641/m.15963 type:complete len:296 (+) Transcript_7641:119-1006(+)